MDSKDKLLDDMLQFMRASDGGYSVPSIQKVNAWEARYKKLRAAPTPPVQPDLTAAARDVLAERQRQISAEGWTPEHDDEHSNGEMAEAAATYAAWAHVPASLKKIEPPKYWPWDEMWWKPGTARRDLIKAGALILAEIERLGRLTAAQAEGGSK